MRKHLLPFAAVLVLALFLTGCGTAPEAPAAASAETHAAAAPTIPVQTQPVALPPETDPPAAETLPAQTLPAIPTEEPAEETSPVSGITSVPENELPYLQRIERSGHAIYGGPGYDCGFVDTIRRGTYTIVEEAVDRDGNLWGALKSGIGWVNLTEIQSGNYEGILISANYADDRFVRSGAYHHCPNNDEYAAPIVIRAYGKLKDVTLFDILYNGDGCYPGEDFFTLPEMTGDLPLLAELDFPGDMTMYGIRFTDEEGTEYSYILYISGRTGAVVLDTEY